MTAAVDWVRRAGHGLSPDGTSVNWSIAEGRRGRRWREVRARDGGVISSLLLETEPDGRFSHLELSTAAGLLTLHPEGDGALHGNSIGPDGIRHVTGLPWAPDGMVLLEGSSIAQAAAVTMLRRSIEPGDALDVESLIIGLNLSLDRHGASVQRITDDIWAFESGDQIEVAADGTPRLLRAAEWPLED